MRQELGWLGTWYHRYLKKNLVPWRFHFFKYRLGTEVPGLLTTLEEITFSYKHSFSLDKWCFVILLSAVWTRFGCTHSLQRSDELLHWWASDRMPNFSKSVQMTSKTILNGMKFFANLDFWVNYSFNVHRITFASDYPNVIFSNVFVPVANHIGVPFSSDLLWFLFLKFKITFQTVWNRF